MFQYSNTQRNSSSPLFRTENMSVIFLTRHEKMAEPLNSCNNISMNDNAPIENPTNQPNVNTPIEAANEQPVAAPIFTSSEPAPAPAPIFAPTSTPAPAPAEPASIAQPIMSTPTATPEPTAQATPAPAPTSTPNPFLTQTAAPATPAPAPAPAAPAPETPAQNGGGCIASNRVMRDGMMIGYMYREEPIEGKPDSGWRFFAGDEDDEYNDNPDNFHIYSIGTVTEIEKDIMPFLNSPVGSAFIRDENGDIIPDDGETEISIGLREE